MVNVAGWASGRWDRTMCYGVVLGSTIVAQAGWADIFGIGGMMDSVSVSWGAWMMGTVLSGVCTIFCSLLRYRHLIPTVLGES